ncbi:MAG: MBOAT family protein [Oscillospiraceae bacterium]|nr:MBOAT family protein [Oscillospiraceae bacterium]
MVFSSILFLFFFLPALLACYFCLPRRLRAWRNGVLLAFSLLFYACGGLSYLPVLLCSIAVNYLCGLLAAPGRPRALRRAGLWGAAVLGLDAPCQRNPFYVALYVALFPQLVAGPIVRYSTVAQEITGREETLSEFSHGTVRFLFGLGKKMLLANAMGEVADAVFAQSPAAMAAGTAWVGAAAYTLQIYFDFSAYSDMAIGLGRMFGFHFLENFNYPYISQSITEFWRRWHISLSSWFRDYVYIPLGGSRRSPARNILNLASVWLLTGLWHGAAWTFVLWGAWFLLLLAGEKLLWGRGLARLPRVFRHGYTLLAVTASWVLFRSPSAAYAGAYFQAMLGLGGTADGQAVYYLLQYWPEWAACLIAALPVKNRLQSKLSRREGGPAALALVWCPKLAALALLALSYLKLATGSFNPFIYFQF